MHIGQNQCCCCIEKQMGPALLPTPLLPLRGSFLGRTHEWTLGIRCRLACVSRPKAPQTCTRFTDTRTGIRFCFCLSIRRSNKHPQFRHRHHHAPGFSNGIRCSHAGASIPDWSCQCSGRSARVFLRRLTCVQPKLCACHSRKPRGQYPPDRNLSKPSSLSAFYSHKFGRLLYLSMRSSCARKAGFSSAEEETYPQNENLPVDASGKLNSLPQTINRRSRLSPITLCQQL